MARFNLALLAIILSSIGFNSVQACENKCREDPVTFLTKKYEAVLQYQANTLMTAQAKSQGSILIDQVLYKLQGKNNVIDSTIFGKFRGPCVEPGVGLRSPEEFCGSAKAIACFAPWGHRESVFDSVHAAVVDVLRATYKNQTPLVWAAMVDGVDKFCPDNCQDWVAPFQNIMLVWEQREHPHQYNVTPNCLELGKGGI
ncbi:hypothetical protein CPB97_007222 [Podila verticillata]|nr:hypothetical protein CPB97_007222 [Podila verticillata]